MVSKYLREQRRYSQAELQSLFECSAEEAVSLIRKLKEYGVIKTVHISDAQKDMTDLLDEDIAISDVEEGDSEYYYIFTFVGIIIVAGKVLKVYPKYLPNDIKPKQKMIEILKVLEKYNSKEQIIRMYNESSHEKSFNLLAVLLYLLNDYHENGSYNNTENIIESNGSGEILWDRTINETFTLISNNRPYYIDIQTRKTVNDEFDYFKRLHEYVVTTASKELEDADLLDLFELLGVDLSDEEAESFGDTEYVLDRIEKELNIQFNTRKQMVLKTMFSYFSHKGTLFDIDCFSIFGTNSFNLVWEHVCAETLDNQLGKPLRTIRLPQPLSDDYDGRSKLIDIIEKPLWTVTGKEATDTLIPDIVSIHESNNKWAFIIFDAKYYVAQLEKNKTPKGQPGIESVTKQYLYQLAYQKFIKQHSFDNIVNCFILPRDDEKSVSVSKGEVTMEMFKSLGLEDIKVILLSASYVYKRFISGTKISIDKLEL